MLKLPLSAPCKRLYCISGRLTLKGWSLLGFLPLSSLLRERFSSCRIP